MAKRTQASKNPTMTSRKGKRRGKRACDVSPYDIALVKKSGTPFVMAIDDVSYQEYEVFILNPSDVEMRRDNGVRVFWFSNGCGNAPGVMRIAVLNESIEDGLENAADWLSNHARGFITAHDDEYLKERYDEALAELVEQGEDPEDDETIYKAQEEATMDMTYTEAGYLNSWEWGLDDLDPGTDLYNSIINKSLNIYRKEHGEDPYDYSYGYGSREQRKAELKRKYGDRIAARRGNPDVSTRIAALAARLARGEI